MIKWKQGNPTITAVTSRLMAGVTSSLEGHIMPGPASYVTDLYQVFTIGDQCGIDISVTI